MKYPQVSLGDRALPLSESGSRLLNGVCPYFTMYPLPFPLGILKRHALPGEWVLDPFCGRGTTPFAARLLALPTAGIDSSPIASAIAKAKLATSTPNKIVASAREIINTKVPGCVPQGSFWKRAYHPSTLRDLCRLRASLLTDCSSDTRILLRAIVLGALHGPGTKSEPSYFSNQCPRTFAPKPAYAVKFWRVGGFKAPKVDVLGLIERRAKRYLTDMPGLVEGWVRRADARSRHAFGSKRRFSWVITSPPYYGMRTYIPDQWLRNWFLGGPSEVSYKAKQQIQHLSPNAFVNDLASVWMNTAAVCLDGARLVIRFGGINDRRQEPMDLLAQSLRLSGWRMVTLRNAGDARDGRRQADQFLVAQKKPIPEYDVYARLTG